MSKIFFIKQEGKFRPYYPSDIEEFDKMKSNVVMMAEIRQPRNPGHHKKCFALAKCVITNLPESSSWQGKNPYALIKAIELQTGYVDTIIKLSGEAVLVPQSIDFESMDQEAFQEFYTQAISIMAAMIGVTVDELENNSMDYM